MRMGYSIGSFYKQAEEGLRNAVKNACLESILI